MLPCGLTARQAEILAYIDSYIELLGHHPSVREICRAFGWKGTHAASDQVRALKRKGFLVDNSLFRNILVVAPAGKALVLSLLC
jgi:repressor LexA